MSDHILILVVLGLNVINVALALIRTVLHIEKHRAWKGYGR